MQRTLDVTAHLTAVTEVLGMARRTRCQWITQLYLPLTRLSTNGISFAFLVEASPHLPTAKGWNAELT